MRSKKLIFYRKYLSLTKRILCRYKNEHDIKILIANMILHHDTYICHKQLKDTFTEIKCVTISE